MNLKFKLSPPILVALLFAGGSSRLTFGQDADEVCVDGECEAAEPPLPPPVVDYSKIYQQVWDADQNGNGVPTIRPSQRRNKDVGYVVVDEPTGEWDGDRDRRIHPEVFIPPKKRSTYDLMKALFDNYTLDQSKPETPQTDEEKAEVKAFIDAILDTEPMQIAKRFIESELQYTSPMTDGEWYDMVYRIWFYIYRFTRRTPHRSGFEHIVVGEQNGDKIGGYHWWHKYYLDDQAKEGYANGEDNMRYNGPRYGRLEDPNEGVKNTEVITMSHTWYAVDFETDDLRTTRLFKSRGGYQVGCSPEGLIAIGLVAFHDPRERRSTVINGAMYEMRIFKAGPGNTSLNTYFARFEGFAVQEIAPPDHGGDQVDGSEAGDVRIIAALVNPEGRFFQETVTLINPRDAATSIEGWTIAGINGNAYKLVEPGLMLDAGEVRTFRLCPSSAQLGHESGKITLRDVGGNVVHTVDYSKEDVKPGSSIVFGAM